jgi:hypothetical protein
LDDYFNGKTNRARAENFIVNDFKTLVTDFINFVERNSNRDIEPLLEFPSGIKHLKSTLPKSKINKYLK